MAAMLIMVLPASMVCADTEKSNVFDPGNFGGSGDDKFVSVIQVGGGFVAVGHSNSFGNGDLAGMTGKGGYDAIIVKYDEAGTVKWVRSFGGSGDDHFTSVTEVSGGYVAVGYSTSIGSGDWSGTTGRGGQDAIIVKYDVNGSIVWKNIFGGSGTDSFASVVAVSGDIIAVGHSDAFGSGDWSEVDGKGSLDAAIVKFDQNGNKVWAKNFGGTGWERFISATAVSDGIVAVGVTDMFRDDGDWAGSGVKEKGGVDAIIVKFDNQGEMIWAKNFGGSNVDYFYSVAAVPDGIIAVGVSWLLSFGNGDWTGVQSNGNADAIIVKYNNNGGVVWKKNFGGSGIDYFYSVTAVTGGCVAVGYSNAFGSGDWSGTAGKGSDDAIAVQFDSKGNVIWKKNFGGSGIDHFNSVASASDGIVAAGYSASFGNGDWTGVAGKGGNDAILVMFEIPFIDEEKSPSSLPLMSIVIVCLVIGAVVGLAVGLKVRAKKKTK